MDDAGQPLRFSQKSASKTYNYHQNKKIKCHIDTGFFSENATFTKHSN